MAKRKPPRPFYIVSGGDGTSGKHVMRTALAQFEGADVPINVVPRVRTERQLKKVLQSARDEGATVLHTLVDAKLRLALVGQARDLSVRQIDLIGRVMNRLGSVLGQEAMGQPGRYRQLREEYFDRVDAIEFAVTHDDGRRPDELHQADIVILGVSRVGKTPLTMYLSMMGWRGANVPFARAFHPPDGLAEVDERRVVGLTVDPSRLHGHRTMRTRRLKNDTNVIYTDTDNIREEVRRALLYYKQQGFPGGNATDKPIEESSEEVLNAVAERFGDENRATIRRRGKQA